jgi:hypothetical protein
MPRERAPSIASFRLPITSFICTVFLVSFPVVCAPPGCGPAGSRKPKSFTVELRVPRGACC